MTTRAKYSCGTELYIFDVDARFHCCGTGGFGYEAVKLSSRDGPARREAHAATNRSLDHGRDHRSYVGALSRRWRALACGARRRRRHGLRARYASDATRPEIPAGETVAAGHADHYHDALACRTTAVCARRRVAYFSDDRRSSFARDARVLDDNRVAYIHGSAEFSPVGGGPAARKYIDIDIDNDHVDHDIDNNHVDHYIDDTSTTTSGRVTSVQ